MTKDKPPTDAQARRLASLWGQNGSVAVGKNVDASLRVLLRNGWLCPSGTGGQFPNGTDYMNYRVSQTGIWALATYFINKAHGR